MLWALLFGAIVVLWLVVTAILLLRLYRKFRALLGSLGVLGDRLSHGMELVTKVAEQPLPPDKESVEWLSAAQPPRN